MLVYFVYIYALHYASQNKIERIYQSAVQNLQSALAESNKAASEPSRAR